MKYSKNSVECKYIPTWSPWKNQFTYELDIYYTEGLNLGLIPITRVMTYIAESYTRIKKLEDKMPSSFRVTILIN